VNQTPAQYIVERRVKTAAQHLLFSDNSIERIATESGFGNRFYFTRVFSRHVGTSPVAYRKNSRV
jgi:AraC-like DNA-binding protein